MKQLQGKPQNQEQSENCQNGHKSNENSSSEKSEFNKCVKCEYVSVSTYLFKKHLNRKKKLMAKPQNLIGNTFF